MSRTLEGNLIYGIPFEYPKGDYDVIEKLEDPGAEITFVTLGWLDGGGEGTHFLVSAEYESRWQPTYLGESLEGFDAQANELKILRKIALLGLKATGKCGWYLCGSVT